MINLDYKSKKEIAFSTLKLSRPRDGIEIMIRDSESTLPVVGIFYWNNTLQTITTLFSILYFPVIFIAEAIN